MKTLVQISLLTLACTLAISCSKSSPVRSGTDLIYGRWKWQSSVGGFTGHDTVTPAVVGYTRIIRFSENGEYEEFRSDSLIGTTRFTVDREKTIFSPDSLTVIRFADTARFASKVLWKVGVDSLELGDNCVEPYGHVYIRL